MAVGARVEARRKELGLTVQELAYRAGLTEKTYYRLVGGENVPRLETIIALAPPLETTPQWILFGQEILAGYTVEEAERLVRELRRGRGLYERPERTSDAPPVADEPADDDPQHDPDA